MTSRKKKLLSSLVVFLLLAGGFLGLVVWLGDEGPICPAAFQRLRPGMSRHEVQRIMAVAPSPNGVMKLWPSPLEPKFIAEFGKRPTPPLVHPGWMCWEGKRYLIIAFFDAGGLRVASIYEFQGDDSSLWQRLRRWLTGAGTL